MQNSLIRGGAAGALALTLALAACGSSSDDTATTGASTAGSEASAASSATTEAATASTTAAAGATTTAGASTTAAAAAAGGQAVDLKEWSITVDGDVKAGAATFAVVNDASNPHALAIVKGDSYETLPLLANGAVDTEKLAADAFIGATEKVEGGTTGSLSVTLDPGNYVFFCPIAFGPNSHAKAGQVLSVTVS